MYVVKSKPNEDIPFFIVKIGEMGKVTHFAL